MKSTVDLLLDLLKISSVSGQEQQIIKQLIKMIGIQTDRVGDNLVVKISGQDKTRAVIFNAHVDTVPLGDPMLWKRSYTGEVAGNKIFGLGASDEKATVAVLCKLIEIYSLTKPECDVWFTFVVHEEIDGKGSQQVVNKYSPVWEKYTKKMVVIGEPTGLKKVLIGHKGNAFMRVVVPGDGGHGALPHLVCKKAIDDAWSVWNIIKNHDWAKYSDQTLGMPTVALTGIHSGDSTAANKYGDRCELIIDARTTPKLEGKVRQVFEKLTGCTVELLVEEARCGYMPENVDLAKKLKLPIEAASYACDLVFFTQVGIPGIILGPGEMEVIHKPNEYCIGSQLEKCLAVYSKIVSDF